MAARVLIWRRRKLLETPEAARTFLAQTHVVGAILTLATSTWLAVMHGYHAHGAGDFLTSHGLVLMVAILVMNSVLMLLIFLPSVAATIAVCAVLPIGSMLLAEGRLIAAMAAAAMVVVAGLMVAISMSLGREFAKVIDQHEKMATLSAENARAARTDPLTGVFNRIALPERMHSLVASGETVEVLIIDVDRFGHVNDIFGPAIGDTVLKTVSRRLEGLAGAIMVARLGGDEFAVLTHDGAGAALVASAQASLEGPLQLLGAPSGSTSASASEAAPMQPCHRWNRHATLCVGRGPAAKENVPGSISPMPSPSFRRRASPRRCKTARSTPRCEPCSSPSWTPRAA